MSLAGESASSNSWRRFVLLRDPDDYRIEIIERGYLDRTPRARLAV
jgi:hypothetical protein